jgi:hemolysin activation/secretion protein
MSPASSSRLFAVLLLLSACVRMGAAAAVEARTDETPKPPASVPTVPSAAAAIPLLEEPAAPSEPAQHFDVLEFVVDGNTVLDQETIERAVYPHLGPDHAMSDVQAARDDLEKQYQSRGYLTVAVDIPEQKISDGVVHLRVTEGRVGRLRVTGSRYFDLGEIKAQAPSIAPGTVPIFPEVQKDLAALNRTPDRRVAPVMRPGRAPGTVDVDLNVEDHAPVHGEAELNNRYNQFTRPLRFSGSLRYDNLWQAEHSLGFTWAVAPQHASDSDVLSITYLMPLSTKTSLALYTVHSSSDVSPGATNTVGKGNIYGLRYVLQLPGSTGFYHNLTLGIDHKQFGEATRLLGQDATRTPISYTPLLLQYGGGAQDSSGETGFGLTANFAIADIFGNHDVDFQNKRDQAKAAYFALRADLSRTQVLYAGWKLYGRLAGQVSADPLISNEEYSIGGAESVRGYRESEVLGDAGFAGTVELRTPHLHAAWQDWLPQLELFAFADAGTVKVKQALPGQTANFSLAGRGAGLRLRGRQGLQVAVDWARALRRSVYTNEGDTRVEFRVGQEF